MILQLFFRFRFRFQVIYVSLALANRNYQNQLAKKRIMVYNFDFKNNKDYE
jgi:hypothetical protein